MEKAIEAFYIWWDRQYNGDRVLIRPKKFAEYVYMAGVKNNDYVYASVEEYEKYSGFTVNEAFRMGWDMARTTNALLGFKETVLEADDFSKILRESAIFCGLHIDQIFFECKADAFTLGNILKACRKFDIGLSDKEITDPTRRFID